MAKERAANNKEPPERGDFGDESGDDEDNATTRYEWAAENHEEIKALPKAMSKMMARKSWRFLRLMLRIKRGLLRPYRIHKELLRLGQEGWAAHELNPNNNNNNSNSNKRRRLE